jgi:hypothetical protein
VGSLVLREGRHFPEGCVPASVLDLGCSRIASCCEAWDQTPQSVKSAVPTPKRLAHDARIQLPS